MHYTLRILSLNGLFILFSLFSLQAQTAKIGYVDMQKLYGQLPAAAQVEKEYNDYSKRIYAEIEQKKKALDEKSKLLLYKKPKTIEESAAAPTAEEIKQRTALATETDAFYQEQNLKQKQVLDKREALYTTLKTKVQQAIREVATEKGYSSIMDVSLTLYYSATDDITSIVLDRLSGR